MNKLGILTLKSFRKIYQICFGAKTIDSQKDVITNPQESSEIMYKALASPLPCMIARFGSTEMNIILNFLSINEENHSWIKYIIGKSYDWWWNEKGVQQFKEWSGFFPLDEKYLNRFSELMLSDAQYLDVLGSWLDRELLLIGNEPNIKRVQLLCMEPYWAEKPWTRILKGKKVLVIHPFATLIEKQYKEYRSQLFKNPDVLPEFELQTIQAVQSLGGDGGQFKTWFDALQFMEDEISKRDYDIALIGCGAYGFPLAAYVKRSGKKAVHLGGALQLLFGIKGRRWEIPNYGGNILGRENPYFDLFNDYWCRPGSTGRPANAQKVEGACYW